MDATLTCIDECVCVENRPPQLTKGQFGCESASKLLLFVWTAGWTRKDEIPALFVWTAGWTRKDEIPEKAAAFRGVFGTINCKSLESGKGRKEGNRNQRMVRTGN